MQTANTTTELANVFTSLKIGDMVEVHVQDAKPRLVRVTELPTNELAGRYIFTSSGKVRPGHMAGGVLRLSDYDGRVSFQPTMQQQVRPVMALVMISTSH